MKRILCPTDFSETAHNAIAYAAKFAQVTESELVLFNVQSLFALSPVELIKGKSDAVEMVKEQLEAQSREVAKIFKISCYSEVQLSGIQLSSLIGANAKDFDLIIMGTDGENDLYQFLSGSNTYNVIKKADVPVLLIPPDCSFNEIALTVYAFDYLKEEKLPLDQLSEWMMLLKSRLRVLEVLESSFSLEKNKNLQQLQGLIEEIIPSELSVTFSTVHSKDVADSINLYVLENDGDMLALCTQHHLLGGLFHKSVIKAISIRARYPVFVFHH
jgi:nucleotide-binding universal stress UspA family protein